MDPANLPESNSRAPSTLDTSQGAHKEHGSYLDSASTMSGNLDKDIEKAAEASVDPPSEGSQPRQATKDPNLVDWENPEDPDFPQNWRLHSRLFYSILLASMTWVVTFASSVFSTGTFPVVKEFGVSLEVATLGTSLFVVGFGLGPWIWGPLSELYGRKPPLFFAFAVFAIFQIPVAVAQNVQTIMICRFFGGLFGVAPLAIVGGIFADMWDAVDRGIAIALFAAMTFVGPIAGPVMGGFITQSHLGWRWTAWVTLIMASSFGILALVLVPETYGPVILKRRAQRLRQETKNWAIHAKIEETSVSWRDIAQKYLLRPAQMIATEPILVLVTIYMAFIYGILYLFFESYPITFQEDRGWNQGVGALPFLSIFVGIVVASALVAVNTKTRYARLHKELGRVPPEERLILMMVGACVLPAGLFWFAWTSSPNISWVPQVLAGAPIGFGIFLIFLQGINYIIDVYLMFANSALAANTFLRSLFGAGFPLFAVQMYHRLGVPWATSLLAFLCIAMAPIPFLFYRYGSKIRALSRFAPK